MTALDLGPAHSWWKAGSEPTAAESAMLKNHEAVAYRVLQSYAEYGPMTADECAAIIDLSVLSVRPSVSRLKKYGYLTILRDAEGKKVRRPNDSARMAMVHELSGKGRDALAGQAF